MRTMDCRVKPGNDKCHDPLPHPPPVADAFSQLPRGEHQRARRRGGAGWAERRRKNQLPGGDLVPVAGTRPAAGDAGGCRRQSGRRLLGGVGRGRRRAWACHPRHRHRSAGRRSERNQPPLPHRPRAGRFGHRVRRSSAHGVADACDGRIVPWCCVRAAALLRPAGAGDRQRAFQPRLGAGALLALAQPAARSAQLRRPLVRRDRARNRGACGRGRGHARPDPDETRRDAARTRRRVPHFRPPRSRSTAGWRTR